jgi:hypothetical protein
MAMTVVIKPCRARICGAPGEGAHMTGPQACHHAKALRTVTAQPA